jgi:hypothetical protein
MTDEKSIAEKLFEAHHALAGAEEDLCDILVEQIFKWADTEDWQFQDFHFDYYDESLELDKCNPDFRVTGEQAQAIYALGFKRFWVNYTNQTEASHFPGRDKPSWKHKSNLCAWIKEPVIPFKEGQDFEPDEELNAKHQAIRLATENRI